MDIITAWETIRENIKSSAKESLGYYEMQQHKPWFDEGCSKLLDQRKQAEMQRLQNVSRINGDNLNYVTHKAIRHFMKEKMIYLKDKINEDLRFSQRWL
jgi:alpha/beta superfamily hydrolase